MDNEKDIDCQTIEYLERLSTEEFRRLLQTPLMADQILDLALESPNLTKRLDQILDEDYTLLPPNVKAEMDRIGATVGSVDSAPETISKLGVKDDVVTRARRWFRILTDTLYPEGSELVTVSAETDEGLGWPCSAEIDVEGFASPIQIEFSWLTFDVVMRYTGPTEGPSLKVECDAIEPDTTIKCGGVVRLGPLEHFGLTATSSRNAIRASLIEHRFRLIIL